MTTMEFTFHHVSIKTHTRLIHPESHAHSHSTMYLLKQTALQDPDAD